MFVSTKRVFTFRTEMIVGYDKNGPITIESNEITYSYYHDTKTIYLEDWKIFNDIDESGWVSQSLKRLHDLCPETYEKLYVLAEEHNEKRINGAINITESNSVDAWKEKRLVNE